MKPGVYLFKSPSDEVLYVGKANLLRNRVSSYFHSDLSARIEMMVSEAARIDYIVATNELEALILECNLIKRHRPRYNVMLRDDKSYPYLVITVADKYPRLAVMRRPRVKGAKIYGPYTARALRKTVDFLRSLFPICNCRTPEKGRNGRCPCLDYHIGRCMAPCMGVDPDAYREMVSELCLFLEGKRKSVLFRLEQQMKEAAEVQEFERAARIRDRINSIKGMLQNQQAMSHYIKDADVIGLAASPVGSMIQLLTVRDGLLLDSKHFPFPFAPDDEIVRSFLVQYYSSGTPIPGEILTPIFIDEHELISEWLGRLRGHKVRIASPVRGDKRKLVKMADENAEHSLMKRASLEAESIKQADLVMSELKDALDLPSTPHRIECYDISTIMGTHSVGSMVLFTQGRPHKDGYRKFRIRKDPGLDDVGMMTEVLQRRFRNENPDKRPDLVVVDGGIGQVNAAKKVLDERGLEIPVIGLAKRLEEVFLPNRSSAPIRLARNSAALLLLQQIRDEAHRFAVTYHRSIRSKEMTSSALDKIPGIGPERRKKLLRSFSSLEELSSASEEEIIRATGMPRQLAAEILSSVRSEIQVKS